MDWIKRFKRKHYFIVCFIATSQDERLTGHIDIICSNRFLNKAMTIQNLEKEMPYAHGFVITNIIRITKKEYKIWESKC